MPEITEEEFHGRLGRLKRESMHLEMRDAYGTEIELPHLAKWKAGQSDDLEWLRGWCEMVRDHVEAGRTIRRARVVSEPLSEYQRWSHSITRPMVDAGEDIRWVPRRLVSAVALPGNDFYLLDDSLVVFLLYAGNGLVAGFESATDPAVVRLCRTAFDAVWALAISHSEYQSF